MKPTRVELALMNELAITLGLPNARVTTTESESGFVVSIEHNEYKLPVAKLEHLAMDSIGSSAHQAGWTLHRIVIDRRHAERAEPMLRRHRYLFKSMAYANYALFVLEEPSANIATDGDDTRSSPPWDITAEDRHTAQLVAAAFTMKVTVDSRQTDLGVVLEVNSADVPIPLDPLLILRRAWDPDARSVVSLAFVDLYHSPRVVSVLVAAGYEHITAMPGGVMMRRAT